MSKAFTREDDAQEPTLTRRPFTPLAPGVKNYMTAQGAGQLRAELDRLVEVERPKVSALADPAGVRQQLQSLDERIEYLGRSLESAVVVQPPSGKEDVVRFGATVRVREPNGEESSYRIVGVDETDVDRGWVSWVSPIAKALMNRRKGERVRFKFPSGEKELEVVGVEYE